MARTFTLAQLRTRARVRANMATSTFVGDPSASGDPEVTGYVNDSVAALWGKLVTAYGEAYYSLPTPYLFSTDGVNTAFTLPSDFFKLVKLQVQLNGTNWFTIDRYMDGEDDAFQIPQVLNFRLYYVQCAPTWAQDGSADEDTFDGINGWEEWVIVDAAIKMRTKAGYDLSDYLVERKALEDRIQAQSRHRDQRQVVRTVDIHHRTRRTWMWNGLGRRVFYQLKAGVIDIQQETNSVEYAWL